MKVAVSLETSQGLESVVAHHFGRCPHFALVELAGGEIQSCQVIDNPFYAAHQPGQVPGFIKKQGVEVMISGGMGRRAMQFFEEYDIQPFTGAQGTAKEVLGRYLDGDLPEAEPCRESVEHGKGRGHRHHHG